MRQKKPYVLILYNHVGEDVYEKLRTVDPAQLGFTPEYTIHVATITEEYEAIVSALESEGFRARAINIEENLSKLQATLARSRPDVVFNLMEYFYNDPRLEAAVAALFDLYRIPYTGASSFALALCQRKDLAKQLLAKNRVLTPKFKILYEPKVPKRIGLNYPLIVKPAREDASLGITKESLVHDWEQLSARAQFLFQKFNQPLIIEEYIEGIELHISILGNDRPQVLPIIEFDFSELPEEDPHIITYEMKWNPLAPAYHKVHSSCPADLAAKVEEEVKVQALRAFRVLDCRDYARVDIRLSEDDKPFVLEVNPNPDLTEGVSFMEAAEEAGLSFSETLRTIAEFALRRTLAPFVPSKEPNVEMVIPSPDQTNAADPSDPQPSEPQPSNVMAGPEQTDENNES